MTTVVSPVTPATVTVAELREVVSIAVQRHPDQRSRIEKAASIVLLREIRVSPYFYCVAEVESESEPGKFYEADAGVGVCDCQDSQRRGHTCKHLWAIRLVVALARLHTPVAASEGVAA
jgi:hypothetical protein